MSKLINIVLISNIFIFTAFAMEIKQDISPKIGEKINNVPQEILAVIADYCLGDFPDNHNDFKEQYKKLLSLRLINKRFKDSIDKHFKHEKIWDKFEDHLIEHIKNKSFDGPLNFTDRLDFAAEIGSKKYFNELDKNINKLDKDSYKLAYISAFYAALKNHYYINAKIILIKHIMPIINDYDFDNQRLLGAIITEYKDALILDDKITAELNTRRFIKFLEKACNDIGKKRFLAILTFSIISAQTLRYFFPQYF